MAWRLAGSLVRLRDQINAKYPNRSRVSDGTIGDSAHAASASDHNPNSAGVVCAFDLTHDPAHGLDAHALANHLLVNRHPTLKYIISNRRIAGAWTNWQWQPYSGSNPHSSHVHFSVGRGPDGQSSPPYDDTSDWNITSNKGEDMVTAEQVKIIWRNLLGREPDANDIDANAGKAEVGQLLNTVANSPESKEYRDELTKHAYRGYLRRDPESTQVYENARRQAVRPFFNGVAGSVEAKEVTSKFNSAGGNFEVVQEPLYRKKG